MIDVKAEPPQVSRIRAEDARKDRASRVAGSSRRIYRRKGRYCSTARLQEPCPHAADGIGGAIGPYRSDRRGTVERRLRRPWGRGA